MMPGVGQMKKAMAGANIDEKVFDRQIAIINSMTKKERAEPDLLNASAASASPPVRALKSAKSTSSPSSTARWPT